MRVYIVGGPGAGKTDLAAALGRRLGLTHLDLDDLWGRLFERGADGQITTAARLLREKVIAEYVHRNDWVIEGAGPPFLDAFAEASDLVVWCDVPFVVAALRIVRRHVVADLRGQNRHPGYHRLFRFIRAVRHGYVAAGDGADLPWTTWSHTQVAQGTRRHQGKVLRLVGGSAERNLSTVAERVDSLGARSRPRDLSRERHPPRV